MSKPDTKTYILELNNGNIRKVSVPTTWKLTFGPTIPFAGKGAAAATYSTGGGPLALRFYEGNKENLRAVFTDVRAFRDAEIEIQERRTETKQQVVAKESAGGMSNVMVEARITQWVNPDDESPSAPANTAAALPYLLQMDAAKQSY